MSDSPTSAQSSSFRVVPAQRQHVEEMVACHLAIFPGHFTSELGAGYLRRSHRYYVERPGGICLVCINDQTGRVVGFVKGGRPELRSEFTRWNMWRFVGRITWRFFASREIRRRLTYHLAEAVRKLLRKLHVMPAKTRYPAPPEDPPGTWSMLISVGVHPDFRGRGMGRVLMDAFRAESARRGYKTMRLGVRNDNEAAIGLYRKCGWNAVLTTPDGSFFKRSVEDPA